MGSTYKFPKNPKDKQQVCDRNGVIWEYDTQTRSWSSHGLISAPIYVSEENDGLVDQATYQRILELKNYLESGASITPFKLDSSSSAYWYYFKSSDKLIKFIPEGPSTLRIEVDRARLFSRYAKQVCVGDTGQKGDQGTKGTDGLPGPNELIFDPITLNNKLDFAIYTPAPLKDPTKLENAHIPDLSLRLFEETRATNPTLYDQISRFAAVLPRKLQTGSFAVLREQLSRRSQGLSSTIPNDVVLNNAVVDVLIEDFPSIIILISPDSDNLNVRIENGTDLPIDLDKTIESIKYYTDTELLTGSIYLTNGTWEDKWYLKSRQRGPDGPQGPDGSCRIQIVDCPVDNSNIVAVCPIVNVRLDCSRNVFYTTCAEVLEEITADKVSVLPNSGTLSTDIPRSSTFLAAEMTLDSAKYVHQYKIELPTDLITDLELTNWDPQPGCLTKRNFDRHKFDWVPLTDIPACDDRGTWYSPTSVRPGKYPWEIITASEPEVDQCCAEDFFYVPNTQIPCDDSVNDGGHPSNPGHLPYPINDDVVIPYDVNDGTG